MLRGCASHGHHRRFAAALCAAAALCLAGPTVAATGNAEAAPPGHALAPAKKRAHPVTVQPVDINSAGRAELKTLPGVGDAEADRIVAARPYLSKAELVTKKVMPTGPYLSLKDRVIALQKSMPKAKG